MGFFSCCGASSDEKAPTEKQASQAKEATKKATTDKGSSGKETVQDAGDTKGNQLDSAAEKLKKTEATDSETLVGGSSKTMGEQASGYEVGQAGSAQIGTSSQPAVPQLSSETVNTTSKPTKADSNRYHDTSSYDNFMDAPPPAATGSTTGYNAQPGNNMMSDNFSSVSQYHDVGTQSLAQPDLDGTRSASSRPSDSPEDLLREPEENYGKHHLITNESISRMESGEPNYDMEPSEEDRWFEAHERH